MQDFSNGILLLVFIFCSALGLRIHRNRRYKKTAYYQITKNSYSSMMYDKGKFGEYLIYDSLRCFETNGGKFLFNLYLPKANEHTAEIDVILICSKGVFVFESKNFSGWIFGNEAHKNWTQMLPRGRGRNHKERFYNPIMQNAAHIRHLKRLVGESVQTKSIIVFSDECTLRDITVNSDNVSVINRHHILPIIIKMCNELQSDYLTQTQIDDIYNILYPYTQIDRRTKEDHANKLHKYKIL